MIFIEGCVHTARVIRESTLFSDSLLIFNSRGSHLCEYKQVVRN